MQNARNYPHFHGPFDRLNIWSVLKHVTYRICIEMEDWMKSKACHQMIITIWKLSELFDLMTISFRRILNVINVQSYAPILNYTESVMIITDFMKNVSARKGHFTVSHVLFLLSVQNLEKINSLSGLRMKMYILDFINIIDWFEWIM